MKIESQSPNIAEIQLSYKSKIAPKDRIKISSSKDIVDVLRPIYQDLELKESFYIILLNRANKILGWNRISVGGLTGTVVDPRGVFQLALKANACAIILAHNHPSGNNQPSQADIDLTKKLASGAKLLEICVLDHIILTEDSYYSFADEGMI